MQKEPELIVLDLKCDKSKKKSLKNEKKTLKIPNFDYNDDLQIISDCKNKMDKFNNSLPYSRIESAIKDGDAENILNESEDSENERGFDQLSY